MNIYISTCIYILDVLSSVGLLQFIKSKLKVV